MLILSFMTFELSYLEMCKNVCSDIHTNDHLCYKIKKTKTKCNYDIQAVSQTDNFHTSSDYTQM